MVYKCVACGEIFDEPYVEKHYSEECGDCSILRCPECGEEYFTAVDICPECGKVMPIGSVVCKACLEYAWEQLDQFIQQFSQEMVQAMDDLLESHRLTEIRG